MNQEEIIEKLKQWGEINSSVKALVLTSSRSSGSTASVDQFSDYDVAVYADSLNTFQNDEWLSYFGSPLVFWPLKPQTTFSKDWLTRLVIFESRLRIDFQITDKLHILPFDFDLGYQVLVDKDGITKNFPQPTKTKHLIQKPTEEEFLTLVNDFLWDGTYVPKYLWRGDLFYAKFMFDSALRFDYFEKMIEWYVGSKNNWTVTTNVHGRYFPKCLDLHTWEEVKQTFAGADIEENWQAFFKMVELFTRFAKEVAQQLNYEYPTEQEEIVREYYQQSKNIR